MEITETVVMLMAEDMDRAVAFWRDGVGLGVRSTSPFWSELVAGSTVIALHGGGGARALYSAAGGRCDRPAPIVPAAVRSGPEDRTDEGIRLADVVDTEGNAFMVSASIS